MVIIVPLGTIKNIPNFAYSILRGLVEYYNIICIQEK